MKQTASSRKFSAINFARRDPQEEEISNFHLVAAIWMNADYDTRATKRALKVG